MHSPLCPFLRDVHDDCQCDLIEDVEERTRERTREEIVQIVAHCFVDSFSVVESVDGTWTFVDGLHPQDLIRILPELDAALDDALSALGILREEST